VASEISGAVGEFVGKVEKKRGPYVLMMEGPEVKKGERLRVQDRITGKGTGFTLLSVEMRGSEKWIKVPFDVRIGDPVYRVSSRRDRKKVTESAGSRFVKLPSSGIQFTVAITDPLITLRIHSSPFTGPWKSSKSAALSEWRETKKRCGNQRSKCGTCWLIPTGATFLLEASPFRET
jgi:hypothetical protein